MVKHLLPIAAGKSFCKLRTCHIVTVDMGDWRHVAKTFWIVCGSLKPLPSMSRNGSRNV